MKCPQVVLSHPNRLHYKFQEGGPIGLIENGDIIAVDIKKKRIDIQLTDAELNERRKRWTPPAYKADRGVLYKIRISEMLLGKVPSGFTFAPKHKSNAYDRAENG